MIFLADFPPFAFQIQRLIAECPAGGGEVTEVSRAVDRIRAGDFDSWQEGWTWLADHVRERADSAVTAGRTITARDAYFRAANYYRSAEFFPPPRPPRQAADLGSNDSVLRQGRRVLGSSVRGARPALSRRRHPPLLPRSPQQGGRTPTNGALSQRRRWNEGGVLVPRRQELRRSGGQLRGARRAGSGRTTSQTEPALSSGLRGSGRTGGGRLAARGLDVLPERIALVGISMGGYYAGRAGAYVDGLAALALHGACHSIKDDLYDHYPGIRPQLQWVAGVFDDDDASEYYAGFDLAGHLHRCPCADVHLRRFR